MNLDEEIAYQRTVLNPLIEELVRLENLRPPRLIASVGCDYRIDRLHAYLNPPRESTPHEHS